MSSASEDLVLVLARLSRLAMTREEAADLARELTSVLDAVAVLDTVDLEGVEPMRYPPPPDPEGPGMHVRPIRFSRPVPGRSEQALPALPPEAERWLGPTGFRPDEPAASLPRALALRGSLEPQRDVFVAPPAIVRRGPSAG